MQGGGLLDASDLGFDDEQCRGIEEELGSPPPWSLESLKNYFDSRFPGWDEAPTLAVSSPLSRLRGLSEAFHSNGEATEDEALRDFEREAKHAQIRIMCPRGDGTTLQDECNFLINVLEQVGSRLLLEREGRRSERDAAAAERSSLRTGLQNASSEAMAAAKDEVKSQLDEFVHEADAQRQRAERLQREADALRAEIQHHMGLEQKVQMLEREALHWKQTNASLSEELREVKGQRAALAVAHQESEGAVDDLQRRLSVAATAKTGTHEPPTATSAPPPPEEAAQHSSRSHPDRGDAFARGARAALSLQAANEEALRPALLAWRCARLEGRYARLGDAAAAESLQADFKVSGVCTGTGGKCCCDASEGSCCRSKWLNVSLKMLQDERAARARSEVKAGIAARRALFMGIITLAAVLLVATLVAEPRFSEGW